jgi:hypothetical protein
MGDMSKFIGLGLFVLFVVFGLGWVVEGNDFFMYKFFAPRRAAVERQVFENTKSYNQGMAQQLGKMFIEYQSADVAGKQAICSVVRHDYADYPDERLSGNLVGFIHTCQR